MLKITNITKGPVQILINSGKAPNRIAVKNIPAIGSGKNEYLCKDERVTEYIKRAEKDGLIKTQYISNGLLPLNKLKGE